MYISPEFQLGQVYDGTLADDESVLLYRPVYVRLAGQKPAGATDKPGTAVPTSARPTPIAAASRTIRKQSAPVSDTLMINTSSTVIPAQATVIVPHSQHSPAMLTAASSRSTVSPATESAVTAPSSISPTVGSTVTISVNKQHLQQQQNTQQVVVDLHDIRLLNTCTLSSTSASAMNVNAVNGQPVRKTSMTLLTSADDDQALVTFSDPLLYQKKTVIDNKRGQVDGDFSTAAKDTDRLLHAKSVHKISITSTPNELR